MRIIVTGGRYFNDIPTLQRILDWINPTEVIQGGAPGADTLARHWCESNGVRYDTYAADWNQYGRAAGPIRNENMLKQSKPDAVVAFPGNAGTSHMISIAEREGVPVYETCFVFGSNLAGRHGKGAAVDAYYEWQAKMGVGCGPTGWAYAIPTKDETIRRLDLSTISKFVKQFITYAQEHPKTIFFVTKIGCGLAGYKTTDIKPMFVLAPRNCLLPIEFGTSSMRFEL